MPPNSSQRSRDSRTRIPPQIERKMAMQMKKNMPASMQKYVGPYMEQHVMGPSNNGSNFNAQAPTSFTPHPQPHAPRPQSLVFTPTNQAAPTIANNPSDTNSDAPPQEPYDFIVHPEQPESRSILGGVNSKIVKVMFVLGGLLLLLIVFMFVKGLISGGSNMPSLLQVVQDQQEIIHLTTAAEKLESTSDSNATFAATTSLSVSSSQSRLINYMSLNGKKVKSNDLAAAIDGETDKQLESSLTSNSYNETFVKTMNEKLLVYMSDLQKAYAKTKGANGKALLNSDYDQAELLLSQIKP